MKHWIKYLFFVGFCFFIKQTYSQNNVGIGTTTPASDAVLELKSSSQGVLVPRLSTAQRLAINKPSNGLLVYDTNYNCFYYYNAPATIWNSMCAGPTSPTQKANVQIYSSQGIATLISDTTPTTVNGLSITVTLVDTATIMLSSTGSITWQDTTGGAILSSVQLYQNSLPIIGTKQGHFVSGCCYYVGFPYPQGDDSWSVSTVISSLPPGTYLFELKACIPSKFIAYHYYSYYAAYNYNKQNQGIITAEVIY